MRDYTADLDSEGRLTLRGDALAARYRVRHRADGAIDLQPEGDEPTSARTLQTIERSMEALRSGEASAPVDLDETFPDLDADQRSRPSTEGTARRALEALHRSAARARQVAAQTGTRLVVVRDGELVVEPVEAPAGHEPPRP